MKKSSHSLQLLQAATAPGLIVSIPAPKHFWVWAKIQRPGLMTLLPPSNLRPFAATLASLSLICSSHLPKVYPPLLKKIKTNIPLPTPQEKTPSSLWKELVSGTSDDWQCRGSFVSKSSPRRRGETTSAQRNPFPLQAELIKLISAVAQNSRLTYFSFKKVKLKSYPNQKRNDLNGSFSVCNMLDVLTGHPRDITHIT